MATTPTDAQRVANVVAELAYLEQRLRWARAELRDLPLGAQVGDAAAVVAAKPAAVVPKAETERGAETESESESESEFKPEPAESESSAERPATEAKAGQDDVAVSPPAEPTQPDQQRDSSGRVLAWVGGSITLVGVVMFLALAASRGWFSIPARLVSGGVLGLALVGTADRLIRRAGGRPGALALAATGIATLYLVVGTATARYEYLSTVVGLVLGLAVAAGGLAVADRWRSEGLAVGAMLGVGVLMLPLVDARPVLVALVLVPQLAAAPIMLRRGWNRLATTTAVFPMLYGSFAVLETAFRADKDWWIATLAAVVAVFVLGAVLAVLAAERMSPVASAMRFAGASVPALAMAAQYGDRRGALLAGLLGLAALLTLLPDLARWLPRIPRVVAPRWLPRPHRMVRIASGAVAAIAVFEATALAIGGAALTGVLLGQALVLTVLASVSGRRGPLLVGAGYGLVGLAFAVFRDAPAAALVEFPAAPYLVAGMPDRRALLTGTTISVLVLLLASAALVACVQLRLLERDSWRRASGWVWAALGAVALYGAAGTVVTLALLVVPRQAGFLGGHAIVTISWTLVALVLLAKGLRSSLPRAAGLVLMAVSLVKLLLFDLVALDGMARVAAFVGAGLVMLASGSHYARLVARSQT